MLVNTRYINSTSTSSSHQPFSECIYNHSTQFLIIRTNVKAKQLMGKIQFYTTVLSLIWFYFPQNINSTRTNSRPKYLQEKLKEDLMRKNSKKIKLENKTSTLTNTRRSKPPHTPKNQQWISLLWSLQIASSKSLTLFFLKRWAMPPVRALTALLFTSIILPRFSLSPSTTTHRKNNFHNPHHDLWKSFWH